MKLRFKINRKIIVPVLMIPFMLMFLLTGLQWYTRFYGYGQRELLVVFLTAASVFTLYLLMKWAERDIIPLKQQSKSKIDKLLHQLDDYELTVLRERLIDFEADYDEEESLESLMTKQKRQSS